MLSYLPPNLSGLGELALLLESIRSRNVLWLGLAHQQARADKESGDGSQELAGVESQRNLHWSAIR
jgi:hypothetical protein